MVYCVYIIARKDRKMKEYREIREKAKLKELIKDFYGMLSITDGINRVRFLRFPNNDTDYYLQYDIDERERIVIKKVEIEEISKEKIESLRKKKTYNLYKGGLHIHAFPISLDGQMLGVLTLESEYITYKKVELFHIIAKQLVNFFKVNGEVFRTSKQKRKLKSTTHILNLVTEISEVVVSINSIDEISKKMYYEMKKNFGECAIGIAVNSPKERKLKRCFYYEFDKRLEFNDICYERKAKSKMVKSVLDKREGVYEDLDMSKISHITGGVPLASYFAPLKVNDEIIGSFTYQTFERHRFTDGELELCRRLVPFVTIALNTTLQNEVLKKKNERLEYHSKYDFLTKLYTRRYFFEAFEKIYEDTNKRNINVHILLFDLNNFKGVNDNFGHHEGDEAIIRVAKLLKDCLKGGLLGRYGGDEFLGGIIGLSDSEIIDLITDIKKRVEGLKIPYNFKNNYISISTGVMNLNSFIPIKDILPFVDKNLYKAKVRTDGIAISNISDYLVGIYQDKEEKDV